MGSYSEVWLGKVWVILRFNQLPCRAACPTSVEAYLLQNFVNHGADGHDFATALETPVGVREHRSTFAE